MRIFPSLVVAPLVLAAAAPAAATFTVNATATGQISAQAARFAYTAPGSTTTVRNTVTSTRINMVSNSSSYRYAFLGGQTLGSFVAFCIEPLEPLGFDTDFDYDVVQLQRAASGIGGIGLAKANLIRELFGRFAPDGGHAAMTGPDSAAFQLAIWEIVMERPGNPLNINSTTAGAGDFTINSPLNPNPLVSFNLAQSWLGQLDGTGPRAKGLVVLQNGTFGQAGGRQDLLAFAGVPEPASWAMLIAGFGLTGTMLRRRTAITGAA
jgi:hypothetical protein